MLLGRLDLLGEIFQKIKNGIITNKILNKYFIMTDLAKKTCIPCRGGVPPLKGTQLEDLQDKLKNDWKIIKEHHLEKEYSFKNFKEALDFTVRVGELAENQDHHPDIFLAWGKVKLTIWTHKIDGLTESDFIFAAKADKEL
ncbi:MAG: putative pterin-4-alpha-carbinolamine dehydratase [Pseudomonadota bacterium]|nr:MAG: putative pterin-4-alpha-carbinolamine dehydratase [Pseudomonadota bacterium]